MKLFMFDTEIKTITEANNISHALTDGVDMFLANIKNAGDATLPHYPGTDQFDYASLKPFYDELRDDRNDYLGLNKR